MCSLSQSVKLEGWNVLESSSPDIHNRRWKYLSNKSHGLNVEKESFPPKQNHDLLSEEGAVGAGWETSHTGVGAEVARVTRHHGQGLEGLPSDLGSRMRYPQAVLQKHDRLQEASRAKFGTNSRLVTPTEFMKRGNSERQTRHPHLTSSQPQEWYVGVMWSKRDWHTLWFKKKKWMRLYTIFTPGNPICSHSNQVLLRFGWIIFLPLLTASLWARNVWH